MPNIIDMTGKKVGRLTVLSLLPKRTKGSGVHARWLCKCSCGSTTEVFSHHLRKKNPVQSCGCYADEMRPKNATRHGLVNSPTYKSWNSMKSRCNHANHNSYADYGGRGITYCDRWEVFENFLADMGERPEGKTLDRTDNEKGYSPENCKWVTLTEQGQNKRNNVNVTINGETKSVSAWSRVSGISTSTIYNRISRGWPEDSLLIKPCKKPLESRVI